MCPAASPIGIGAPMEAIVGGGRVIGATVASGQNGMSARPVKVVEGHTVVAEDGDPAAFKLTPAHVNLALRRAIGLCESDMPGDPLKRFRLNVSQEPMPLG